MTIAWPGGIVSLRLTGIQLGGIEGLFDYCETQAFECLVLFSCSL